MSDKFQQKIARGIVWSATQNWGSQGISFLVFLILARLLTPEAFGLVALASVFTAFLQIFLDTGFNDAIVQRTHVDREHLDTAFWTAILIGTGLTIAGIAGAGLAASFFQEPTLAPIISWLSLSFLFSALKSTQQGVLRRRLAFKSLAIRTLIATLVSGLAGITAAFMGFGVWSLVIKSLVNGVVGTVVLWRVSDWRPGLSFSRAHFKELFSFGINIIGINILNFFNRRSDDLLIGYFLGATTLGYYNIAYRLLLMGTNLLTGVISAVAFPAFSRLQKEPERLRRAFYTATQYTSLISFPAFIGLAVLAPELVPVVYGPQWAPSIPVMQVLAFIGILHSIFYFNSSVIRALGKPAWVLGIGVLNATVNFTAFLLVVRWGIVAVAMAYVIRGYLLSPVPLLAIRRLIQLDFKLFLRQFVPPLVGCLFMVAVILGLKHVLANAVSLYWQLGLYTLAGATTYLLTLQLIAPALLRQLSSLVNSILPKPKLRRV